MKCNHVYHGLATILSVVLLLGGCKDFLDAKPKGKDIPETIEHYNGMFNQYESDFCNLYSSDGTRDEIRREYPVQYFYGR